VAKKQAKIFEAEIGMIDWLSHKTMSWRPQMILSAVQFCKKKNKLLCI